MMTRIHAMLSAVLIATFAGWPVGLLAADVPLIDAVTRGERATIRALLDEGVDVNAPQGDGATALHWAVHLNDHETVSALLDAGAEVDVTNDLQVAPLLIAATSGDAAVVRMLLDAGADPNGGPPERERPLMRAAWVGNLSVVTALLDAGADPNGAESARGQTALMWAVSERHPGVVKILLERGASVHAATVTHLTGRAATRDVAGYTPLLFAARVGGLESARMLLDAGANPNAAASDRLSALGLATIRGHVEVAMLLLDRGADANAGEPGYTPLHWAAGWWETTLTTSDFRAGREGNNEWNALPGLTTGKVDLVRALLANGADPNAELERPPTRAGATRSPGLPELVGATPFLLAAAGGDAELMEILAEAGADTSLTTKIRSTPLMAAAGLGRVMGENTLDEAVLLEAAQLAVQMGADVGATDDIGNSALHYAAYHRLSSLVQFLVDQGAELEDRNKFGETPLWLSELAIQFYGGGTFQIVPTGTGDLLRAIGAQATTPLYDRARPRDWPDLALQ
jgi:ankyrin repeat protein